MDNHSLNEKEMSSDQTTTSQNFSLEVADISSASSPNFNYTQNIAHCQTDFEDSITIIDNTPSKSDLRDIIDKCNIILLHKALHIFNSGIYKLDTLLIHSKIFKVCQSSTPSKAKSYYTSIKYELMNNDVVINESPPNYIGFNNCIYDVNTGKDYDFSSTDFILTNKLGIDYYSKTSSEYNSANVEVINSFFDRISCGNEKLKNYLFFIIGNCICRNNYFKTAFVLTGNNCNCNDGRTEFIQILNSILGDSVAHKNLRSLTNSNSASDLYSKTCNISYEVEHPHISFMDTIRNIILGNEITDIKTHFSFLPFSTLVINVKNILDFDNALYPLKDNFKIIPFNAKHSIPRSITSKLFTSANLLYIALKSIMIYNQALRIGKLPVVDVIERATNKYFLDNNSVLEYHSDNPIHGIICKSQYYYDYCQYCIENNLKRVSRANFGIEIKKLGYEAKRPSFKGIRVQCYIEPDFNLEQCRADYVQHLKEQGNSNASNKDITYDNLVNFINGYEETFGVCIDD